jgi:hypothetical protein
VRASRGSGVRDLEQDQEHQGARVDPEGRDLQWRQADRATFMSRNSEPQMTASATYFACQGLSTSASRVPFLAEFVGRVDRHR